MCLRRRNTRRDSSEHPRSGRGLDGSGSHHIYAQPGNPTILTVPVHGDKDLKRGTLRQLLRDSGLGQGDL
ncbi:MAG: type II toxin-antitoxin system HicA family toxin [Rhodopirellula sp.]|nr:type II toxin-antitoxin system HicA family toxin [Rhodopirellula sp.]